jgi:malonate decarboxylase beta subunit
MSTPENFPAFVNRKSFIELDGRARAQSLFDPGTWKELVGPFDRVQSPWLPLQGIAPQADDGCIVIKGRIGGLPAVVVSLEGAFQGGSIGEVSGAKMTAALDLATKDSEAGKKTAAVLLLETGGVRLQEANLGLAAIAEVDPGLTPARAGNHRCSRYRGLFWWHVSRGWRIKLRRHDQRGSPWSQRP